MRPVLDRLVDVDAHARLVGLALDLDWAALLLPVHLGVPELPVGLALDAKEREHRVHGGLLALGQLEALGERVEVGEIQLGAERGGGQVRDGAAAVRSLTRAGTGESSSAPGRRQRLRSPARTRVNPAAPRGFSFATRDPNMVGPLGADVAGLPDAMETWTELSDPERSAVWDRFYPHFAFRPSITSDNWPGIREPDPFVTFSIPQGYSEHDLDDLHQQVLSAFRACTPPEGQLYALDWQHVCFWFRPHGEVEGPESWRVPVLPNGDYYIFLAEDFRFGIFGHPWERTWCVFGAELLAKLRTQRPRMFSTIRRHSGRGATW